jgi:hypothetical protein
MEIEPEEFGEISRERDEEINEMVPEFGDSIRLRTWVKFRMRDNNWSKATSALIDTGAPISVLPYDLWRSFKKAEKKLIEKYEPLEKLKRELKEEKVPPDDHTVYNDVLEWRAARYELEELTLLLESI